MYDGKERLMKQIYSKGQWVDVAHWSGSAMERITKLEHALETVLSVRMLDNLTAEQMASINAVRAPTIT